MKITAFDGDFIKENPRKYNTVQQTFGKFRNSINIATVFIVYKSQPKTYVTTLPIEWASLNQNHATTDPLDKSPWQEMLFPLFFTTRSNKQIDQ